MVSEDIKQLAQTVVARATAAGMTLATVESCTGGLVAGAITAIPGSSAVLEAGLVTYSNAAKTRLADVPADLIATHGAVSEPVARAMAEGARDRLGTDLAVAITGVAGPGGGSAEKPVGLVHFACVGPQGATVQVRRFGDIGREAVRLESVRVALILLRDAL